VLGAAGESPGLSGLYRGGVAIFDCVTGQAESWHLSLASGKLEDQVLSQTLDIGRPGFITLLSSAVSACPMPRFRGGYETRQKEALGIFESAAQSQVSCCRQIMRHPAALPSAVRVTSQAVKNRR
jgi:hypothetical protein